MSQSGFTPIQLFRTSTAAAVPTAGSLAAGELAINLTDERLYFKNAAGVVKLLASNSGSLGTVTSVDVSGGTTGLTTSGGPITSSGTITLGGTLGVANGGTGTATAFTAGSVVFAGASGVYTQDNANLFWDNANDRLGIGTSSPAAGYKLDVSGSANASGSFVSGGGTTSQASLGNKTLVFYNTGSGDGLIKSDDDTSSFTSIAVNKTQVKLFTSNTEAMRIDSSGNVGIGTTSPSSKLTVASSNVTVNAGYGLAFTGDQARIMTPEDNVFGALINWSAAGGCRFIAGTSERMRIDGSGNVGIGTSSPSQKLSVANGYTDLAGLRLAGTNHDSSNNIYLASGDLSLSTASGVITFKPNTTERMRIDSSGNVGIGTTTPRAQLDVGTNAGGSTTSTFHLGYSGLDFYGFRIANTINPSLESAGTLSFQRGTTSAWSSVVSISDVGNVGIGTTSPVGRLDAVSASATGNIINARNTSSSQFFIGGVGLQNGATANNSGVTIGTGVRDADGTDSFFTINKTTSAGSYVAELAYYDLSADFWKFSTSNAERMRIDSSGNVGIGTSSPLVKLDVNGSINARSGTVTADNFVNWGSNLVIDAGGSLPIIFKNNGTESARIINGGNVGIGTSSPAAKLTISSAVPNVAGGQLIVKDPNYSGVALVQGGSGEGYLWNTSNNFLSIATNNTERMRIDSSGNVGIGTSSPAFYSGRVVSSADGASIAMFAANNSDTGSSSQIVFDFYRNGTRTGNITNTNAATAYNTSSDYRLKEIDGPIANSGAYIDALKPVQGSWKADGSRFIGLLAHEVQEVSETPIATGEKDGEEMQAMDYSAPELITNLIAEIQSLRARVAQLEGN